DQKLRWQPGPHHLQPLDDGVTGGTKRNHQRRFRNPRHAMMHHDPIAVLLCGAIEASLAGPMVALQDGLTMSAEMFLVVMLAGQTSRAHASGHDVERSAGTQEYRLNSFAARPVRQVCEGRTHRSTLVDGRLRAAFRPGVGSTCQSPDFSMGSGSRPKKARWERL